MNMPLISSGGSDDILNDQKRFPTLFRLLTYQQRDLTRTLLEFLRKYSWKDISILCDTNPALENFEQLACNGFEAGMKTIPGSNIITYRFNMLDKDADFRYYLLAASKTSRVIVIVAHGNTTRDIMIAAHRLGMAQGDYVYITTYPMEHPLYGYYRWQVHDERDDEAKSAFKSLYFISLRPIRGPDYEDFEVEVKYRAYKHYGYRYEQTETVSAFTALQHTLVHLTAKLLDETINEGDVLTDNDGSQIMDGSYDPREVPSVTGNFSLLNGDRTLYTYIIVAMNHSTYDFAEVMTYDTITRRLLPVPGKKITWVFRNDAPPNAPPCGFGGIDNSCSVSTGGIIGVVLGVCSVFAVFVPVTIYIARKLQTKEEDDVRWYILPEELIFKNVNPNQNFGSTKSKLNSKTRSKSQLSINKSTSVQLTQWSGNKTFNTGTTNYSGGSIMDSENVAIFKQRPVWVHRIEIAHKFVANSAQEKVIRKMRRTHFANVARFFGLCPMDTEVGVLCEIAHRGNLADAMQAESIKFDNTMKNSAVSDVTSGLMYLHSSGAVYHGELSCGNCLIDNRFVVKLAYFRLDFLPRVQPDFFQDAPEHRKFFTYSPEQLRTSNIYTGSKEGDIYAYGHVLVEIMCEIPPFQNEIEVDRFTAKGIIDRICRQSVIPFRPKLPPQALQSPIRTLVEKCWDDRPQARPTIEYINGYLKSVPGFERDHNFVDDLFKRLATYAEELEQRIRKAQEATYEEKRKAETLLFQVLPQQVANALTRGIKIDPEFFNQVTIGFTGIEDFVYLTSVSSPIQIVVLLNEIYSLFDGTLQQFDVYKVETIADTYMIASGVPMRNGDGHSTQIAELSLELMREAQAFKIKHRPRSNNFLLLKIGCHTGSCVAGVIGNRMPRYCLFGDAVNFASRMTMYGQAFKIQLSASAKEHLERYGLGNFRFQSRGLLEIKGKGPQKCFWLVQKHEKDELPWEKGYRPERTKDTSPSGSSEHLPATRQNTIDRDETGSQKTQLLSVPPAQASRYPKKPSEAKTSRNEKKKESSPGPSKKHEEEKASSSHPRQSSKKSTVEPNKEAKSEAQPPKKKHTEQPKQPTPVAEQKPPSSPLLPSYGYLPTDFSPVKAKNDLHKGHEPVSSWNSGRNRADTGLSGTARRETKTQHAPDTKVRDSLGISSDAADDAPHPDYSKILFNQTTRRHSRDSGKNMASPSRVTKKNDPGTETKLLDTGRGTKHLDLVEARKVMDVLNQKSARKPSQSVAEERKQPEVDRSANAFTSAGVDYQASKAKPEKQSREPSRRSSTERKHSPPRRNRKQSPERNKSPEPSKSSKKSTVRKYSREERKISRQSPQRPSKNEKKGHGTSARHSSRSSSPKAKASRTRRRDRNESRTRDNRRKVRSPSVSHSVSDKSSRPGSSSRQSPVVSRTRERRKSRRSSSAYGKRDQRRERRDERRRSSTSVVQEKGSASSSERGSSTKPSTSHAQLRSWASRQDLSGREDNRPDARSKRRPNGRENRSRSPERKAPSESDADTVTWV